ncbi:MAG TPA: ABC transporter permease [Myxococcales bacterium]
MRRVGQLVAAFLRRDLLVDASYRGNFLFTFAGALFSLWSLYFLGEAFGNASPMIKAAGGDYFRFALVGVSVAVPLRAGMAGVTRRVRELQLMGGLETLASAPVPPFGSVLLLALYPLMVSLFQGLVMLTLGILVFGASFPGASISGAAAGLALGVAAYMAFGILSASLVILLKRGDPVAWAVDALTFLVSGIFYPVEVLPKILHPVASLVPATHALRAMRGALLHGAGIEQLGPELGALAAFAAVLMPASAVVLRLCLRRAAKEGSLGQA